MVAASSDQLVQEVRNLPDEIPAEPFERKLWRYVRDGSYHMDPLTGSYWAHDPVLFLNSIGFGFCDDAAAVFVILARKAGFQARGWDLGGHVVAEIWTDGRWKTFDPDQSVYYLRRDGQVAGVADLALDSSLILSPSSQVNATPFAYSQELAAIYASDNRVTNGETTPAAGVASGTVLPSGARITYPGIWASPPLGYWGSGIPLVAQARLELPDGFVGPVAWPLLVWDVQGSGRVRIAGRDYSAGSSELTTLLQSVRVSQPPVANQSIQVLESTGGLSIIYLLNPIQFYLGSGAELRVRSLNAAYLDVELGTLAEANRLLYTLPNRWERPR